MPFEEYSELVGEPIVLPINGRNYTLPPVSAEAGVDVLGVLRDPNSEAAKKPDLTGMLSIRKLVGDALVDEMLKDKVPYDAMLRAAMVQMADFISGRDAAEKAWHESGLKTFISGSAPEAGAPTRGRKPSTSPRTRTSSTGAASTTRSRASGTNTTSRKRAR